MTSPTPPRSLLGLVGRAHRSAAFTAGLLALCAAHASASDRAPGSGTDVDGPVAEEPAGADTRLPARREGLYLGVGASITLTVPLPTPSLDLGYEGDRVGVRLRVAPLYLVGRNALELTWAWDDARRRRAYLTWGFDAAVLVGYSFAGVGVEWTLGREGRWFVQLDATYGDGFGYAPNSDAWTAGDSVVSAGLAVGVRRD